MKNIILRSGVYLISALALICFVLVLKFYWVSTDAPYYLSIARDLSDGHVLYKDIQNAYTPLVMTFYSYVFSVIEDPSYFIFQLLNVGFVFINGCLLFLLLRKQNAGLPVALMTAAAFTLTVLSSDGNYINLEIYSIFFVLLGSFLLFQNKGYFFAGVLLGCSFLCKQYGVLNFVPFTLYIFLADETLLSRMKKIIFLGAGGLVVFTGFLAYYTQMEGIPFEDLFRQISGSGYAKYSVEKERSLFALLVGAKVFLLFLAIPVIYLVRVRSLSAELKFCLTGLLVNLLPVYYQGFQHYYINTFPYLFLAIGFILSSSREHKFQQVYVVVLILVTTISALFLVARVFRYKDQYATQQQVAASLSKHLAPGSSVYIQGGLRYLYVLNDYKNPFLNTIGYDYTFYDVGALVKDGLDNTILSSKLYQGSKAVTREIKTSSGSIYLYSPQ